MYFGENLIDECLAFKPSVVIASPKTFIAASFDMTSFTLERNKLLKIMLLFLLYSSSTYNSVFFFVSYVSSSSFFRFLLIVPSSYDAYLSVYSVSSLSVSSVFLFCIFIILLLFLRCF